MGLLDLQVIHQGEQVVRHLIDGVPHQRPAAPAGSAVIVNDDLMPFCEGGDIRIPVTADAAEPRDQ
jgi:hypothetical protein